MEKKGKAKKFDFKALGKALIAYRTEGNLSFTNVTATTKIDRSVLHRVERGMPTGVNHVLTICFEIGKPFDSFLK